MTTAEANKPDELIDPDPFSIGLGILGIMFGGASFLETRRTRDFMERQAREAYRTQWFAARRSLIYATKTIEEFETYALEEGFEAQGLVFGRVRLTVTRDRAAALRRLHGQAHTTATRLSDAIDALSDHLGPADQVEVDAIFSSLQELAALPASYGDLIRQARDVLARYQTLLEAIDDREGFTTDNV